MASDKPKLSKEELLAYIGKTQDKVLLVEGPDDLLYFRYAYKTHHFALDCGGRAVLFDLIDNHNVLGHENVYALADRDYFLFCALERARKYEQQNKFLFTDGYSIENDIITANATFMEKHFRLLEKSILDFILNNVVVIFSLGIYAALKKISDVGDVDFHPKKYIKKMGAALILSREFTMTDDSDFLLIHSTVRSCLSKNLRGKTLVQCYSFATEVDALFVYYSEDQILHTLLCNGSPPNVYERIVNSMHLKGDLLFKFANFA